MCTETKEEEQSAECDDNRRLRDNSCALKLFDLVEFQTAQIMYTARNKLQPGNIQKPLLAVSVSVSSVESYVHGAKSVSKWDPVEKKELYIIRWERRKVHRFRNGNIIIIISVLCRRSRIKEAFTSPCCF